MTINALAVMVSNLTHSNFFVLPALAGVGSEIGTDNYTNLLAMWASAAAVYGARFIDVQQALMDANDGSAGDLADIANGITPRSLRNDVYHPNYAGRVVVYSTIDPFLRAYTL
jgi:hypothetical protein